jgi:hypothetical protein
MAPAKLSRYVALKLLPALFKADADHVIRFERDSQGGAGFATKGSRFTVKLPKERRRISAHNIHQ